MTRSWDPAEFAPVLAHLEASEARYVVVGGVAVNLHGHSRKVSDLDVAVEVEAQNERLVMRALAASGFFPSIPLGLAELTVLRTFDFAGREVDLFARTYVQFSELWADSVKRSLGGVAVRVASLDHVLRLTRHSGSAEGLADVEALVGLHKHTSG